MKLKVVEERSAFFRESKTSQDYDTCKITICYCLYINDVFEKMFVSENSLNEYIKYLQEIKNDYRKIIKEFEI